jgi:hypothetical protein
MSRARGEQPRSVGRPACVRLLREADAGPAARRLRRPLCPLLCGVLRVTASGAGLDGRQAHGRPEGLGAGAQGSGAARRAPVAGSTRHVAMVARPWRG